MRIIITTVSTAPATVQVQTAAGAKIEIISTGKVVAQGLGPVCKLEVPKCILWSDATPKLYTCRVTDGAETAEMKFGICQYGWEGSALKVNGRPVQLRPIGFDAAVCGGREDLWRRVLILKDGYFNAVACGNATEELKAACDYYGMYLLTENEAAEGDSACVVGNAPVSKLGCVPVSAVDAAGNLRPECAYATTVWEMELEVRFSVRPGLYEPAESWAWHGCEGQKMDVEVYALAPSVELKLNGKSLGKKKTTGCKAVYKVGYTSGKLEASAFNGSGTKIAGGKLESATGETKLCLRPESTGAKAGDVVFIPVTIEGENGIVVCGADRELTASVIGGELLQVTAKTENGRGLVAVRVQETATVQVSGGDLNAEILINVQ